MSALQKVGYADTDERAKMNFVGDVAAAEEAMQPVGGSMSALINLDVLPKLEPGRSGEGFGFTGGG